MKYSLNGLIILLSIACVVALAIGKYVASPERRVRAVGIPYNKHKKAGDFLSMPAGTEFDDDSLAEVVKIAADFSKPHSIGISGNKVTDNGFQVFQNAPNICHVYLTDMAVSDSVLQYFDEMPDLRSLTIKNCPNITKAKINEFQYANIKIDVRSR